jgi:hypothetical protein
MAELVNGHITVRTGLIEAGAAPVRRVPRGTRPSDGEMRARVVRLRREGWSYRRIAATLELRYAAVAEILDGPTIWVGDYRDVSPAIPHPALAERPDAETPARHLAAAPKPPSPVPAARDGTADAVEAVLVQHARLSDKVDALLRAAEQQRSALARLEGSIIGSIRSENASLGDRLLAGIKTLFERLLPVSRRGDGHSGD